jgi:hypothetical protein
MFGKKTNCHLGYLSVIYTDLMFLNPNMATKMLYCPQLSGEKGLKLKNVSLVKRVNIFLKLLYTVQNIKIVPVYNIPPKNK